MKNLDINLEENFITLEEKLNYHERQITLSFYYSLNSKLTKN